jgi:FkbM family methyltransferase
MLAEAMKRHVRVCHGETKIDFVSPNPILLWRASTFSEKEPETLRWIDDFDNESVLWDVGANVGLYAIYAAKAKKADVWAFEPSIFNLEILGRNIVLNQMEDKVKIMPLALTDKLGVNRMSHSTTEWGGALSTFGANYGSDGEQLDAVFKYDTFGMCLDDIVKYGFSPVPDHIKIDVDGIEHIILRGGVATLKAVKSVLVEINDDFGPQHEQAEEALRRAGLRLEEKERSVFTNISTVRTPNVFNQIWRREV